MPYIVTAIEDGITQVTARGILTKSDIDQYVDDLVVSDQCRRYGRLLLDYAELEAFNASYDDLKDFARSLNALEVDGGEIWQAGINAETLNVGLSRQANTLVEMNNAHIDSVKLKFFPDRATAIDWLKSKPVDGSASSSMG